MSGVEGHPRMGRAAYDLEHLDFDGELVGAAFRIPREWDEVVTDVVESSEAVLMRRGAGRRVNKSSVFRHIFHMGYRQFVHDQAIKWLQRGIAPERVAERLRIEDELLHAWLEDAGMDLEMPRVIYPPLNAREIAAIRAMPETDADPDKVKDMLDRLV